MLENVNFIKIINYLEKIVKNRSVENKKTYTSILLSKHISRISQKVGEEAVELVIASNYSDKKEIVCESADLLFHLMLLWNKTGVSLEDIAKELESRKNE